MIIFSWDCSYLSRLVKYKRNDKTFQKIIDHENTIETHWCISCALLKTFWIIPLGYFDSGCYEFDQINCHKNSLIIVMLEKKMRKIPLFVFHFVQAFVNLIAKWNNCVLFNFTKRLGSSELLSDKQYGFIELAHLSKKSGCLSARKKVIPVPLLVFHLVQTFVW